MSICHTKFDHSCWRNLLALICLTVAIAATGYSLFSMNEKLATSWRINYVKSLNSNPVPDLRKDEKEALKLRMDSASRVFQIGLAVMAALWALVIAKKGEFGLNRRHRPELVMFFSSNWLFVLSLLAFPTLQLDVAVAMTYTPICNEKIPAEMNETNQFLWDKGVWRFSWIAIVTLLAATLTTGCTILSTRLLAEDEESGNKNTQQKAPADAP